jgi:hypothetical protein
MLLSGRIVVSATPWRNIVGAKVAEILLAAPAASIAA